MKVRGCGAESPKPTPGRAGVENRPAMGLESRPSDRDRGDLVAAPDGGFDDAPGEGLLRFAAEMAELSATTPRAG